MSEQTIVAATERYGGGDKPQSLEGSGQPRGCSGTFQQMRWTVQGLWGGQRTLGGF